VQQKAIAAPIDFCTGALGGRSATFCWLPPGKPPGAAQRGNYGAISEEHGPGLSISLWAIAFKIGVKVLGVSGVVERTHPFRAAVRKNLQCLSAVGTGSEVSSVPPTPPPPPHPPANIPGPGALHRRPSILFRKRKAPLPAWGYELTGLAQGVLVTTKDKNAGKSQFFGPLELAPTMAGQLANESEMLVVRHRRRAVQLDRHYLVQFQQGRAGQLLAVRNGFAARSERVCHQRRAYGQRQPGV